MALHATIVPATGAARDTRLALWSPPSERDRVDRDDPLRPLAATGEPGEIELVWPAGRGVRRRTVPAAMVDATSAVDTLVAMGERSGSSASAAAWARTTRVVLGLIARGRLQPAIAPDGTDQWIVGPLGPADRAARSWLVDHLPPAAHCLVVDAGPPVRMMAAERAVVEWYQAVADAFPRTAGAPLVAMQRPWASREPSDVSRLRPQLVGAAHTERTVVGIRVTLPADVDAPFVADLQLRSAVDPSRVVDVAALWSGEVPWPDPEAETDLLRGLRRGSDAWPPLRRFLEDAEPHRLELADEEAMELFGAAAVDLGGAGIEVLVPTALTRTLRAEAHVEPPPGAGDAPAGFDLSSVCRLTWRPTIDGEPVTDDELARLAAASRPLVKVRDEWVVVDPRVVAKLQRRDTVRGADALAAALGGELTIDDEPVPVEVSGALADLAARLRRAAVPAEVAAPPGLTTELRPYQRKGVGWLLELERLGFGGVLADDMGLGKTVQVIALLLSRAAGPTLVVCPASVVTNWVREVERFAPDITVRAYTGPDRDLDGLDASPDSTDVVVTTYGLARRDHPTLAAVPWHLVVADEAQHVKNPNSSTARALRRIGANFRLALTGTPVENRLTELWALVDWTTPGLLGPVESFRRKVSLPIERDGDEEVAARFARMIAPFLLRRRKDDPTVVPELPPKTETVQPVVLTAEQAGLYRATTDDILDQIGRADGIARRGLVLKLLTALKQICNHPAHYLGEQGPLDGRSGKFDAFVELIDAIGEAGDSTLVFTQYVVMGRLLRDDLERRGVAVEMLDGSVPLGRRTDMVDRFQAGEFGVFVISLKAGGTGLNLTRATHVIHYDRWWNPAVEDQASDRAWRIGQDRPVQVHHLLSEGTLEERIAEVLQRKKALARSVVGAGEAWLTEMTDDELAEIVALGDGA